MTAGPGTTPVPSVLAGRVLTDRPVTGRLDLGRFLAGQPIGDDTRTVLHGLAVDVAGYLQAAYAPATVDKYRTGWQDFCTFARAMGLPIALADDGLPAIAADPEVVALYMARLAADGVAPSTLDGRTAAIRHAHTEAGLTSPTDHPDLRRLRRGMRRSIGRPVVGKAPVSVPLLAAMITAHTAAADTTPHPAALAAVRRAWLLGHRDRALLLLGWFAGLRRSELAGLAVADLELAPEGLRVLVRRSKTDQDGAGQVVDVAYAPDPIGWLCPVRAVLAWLEVSGRRGGLHRPGRPWDTGGPPLLSGIGAGAQVGAKPLDPVTIRRTVQAAAKSADQPAEVIEALEAVGAHSLRSGLGTVADAAGVEEAVIGRVLRHHGGRVTQVYIRPAFHTALHDAVYALMVKMLYRD